MQQFTVPQFIDVEDKIIGPITTRQFVIMLSGFLIIGISYKIFDFSLFITLSVIIFVFCGTIAFAKVNGRPFHYFILNLAQTFKKPRLRVWRNDMNKTKADYERSEEKEIKEVPIAPAKHTTTSHLAELALVVDTRGTYPGESKESDAKIKSI